MYRIPKFTYYFWQAAYGKNLMAFIQPSFWHLKYLGLKEDIDVNSNGDKVELFVNGVSKGFLLLTRQISIVFYFKNILIEKGTVNCHCN